jgi:hypothetical protein
LLACALGYPVSRFQRSPFEQGDKSIYSQLLRPDT